MLFRSDVEPKEIVAHLSALCKEKGIMCHEVDSKQKLGISAGLNVSTSSIAIIDAGEAGSEIKHAKK